MNRDELRSVLQDAGLSPYQADAYVTVLEKGPASATDIADASDVPDPRIYDVLRSLENRGYIETYEQENLHARAHDLETVLEDLRTRATQFEDAASDIERRWEEPTMDTHTVNFVTRIETVLDRAESLIRAARSQVQIAASRKQFERLKPALTTAWENGVYVRLVIYLDEDEPLPEAAELDGVVTDAQYQRLPIPFIALIDRKASCFAPHELSMNRYGIIVEDRTHAYVMHWFFMAGLWEATDPLYEARVEEFPSTYIDLRKSIQSLYPYLERGETIEVTVEAVNVETGNAETLTGRVVDLHYAVEERIPERYLGGQATMYLDVGDVTVTIGGWGAVVEDYEATEIHVESISTE